MVSDLVERTKKFAHDCVKLAVKLPNTYLGNHVKGQLIRCSTSVAANYRAARLGQSKAVFISKISIVIEEKLLPEASVMSLKDEAHELASIFVKSRKTAQRNVER